VALPPAPKGKVKYTLDVVVKLVKDLKVDRKGEVINESTRKKRLGDIKYIFQVTKCESLEKCLLQKDKVRKAIETAKQIKDPTKDYSINVKRDIIVAIVWVMDHIPIFTDSIKETIKPFYLQLMDVYKGKSKDESKERNDTLVTTVFSEQLRIIKEKYGEDSKEFLVMSLYNECSVRDNFGQLSIIAADRDANDKAFNYLVIPRSGDCKIFLNVYKTKKKYGTLTYFLSPELSKLIRAYKTKNKIPYGSNGILSFLFNDAKLSPYVGRMLKKAGLQGGINEIRHAIFSEQMKDNTMTEDELAKLAFQAGHNSSTHRAYVRKFLLMAK
jgi:hypothetical protein